MDNTMSHLSGGALFFALQPSNAYLSDINFRLIITYTAIRDNVDAVIKELHKHQDQNSKEHFLKMRKEFSKDLSAHKLAALLIYLNKTCYNGLFRVNKSSEFNVPYGAYEKPLIADVDTLYACSQALQGQEIYQCSFTQIPIAKNAFYYLDPPYHQTYSSYDESNFGDVEHQELAEKCHQIHDVGGCFVLSNSDSEFIRKLYSRYQLIEIDNQRSISCKSDGRFKQTELIITNVVRSSS